MFNLTIDGRNISFSFAHHRDVNLTLPLRLNPKKLVTVTDITLCDMLVDGKEYSGEACCVAGDQFRKESGRKVALARALQDAQLPRAIRTLVWDKYFHRGVKDEVSTDGNSVYANTADTGAISGAV
jgi:hypothetical protein